MDFSVELDESLFSSSIDKLLDKVLFLELPLPVLVDPSFSNRGITTLLADPSLAAPSLAAPSLIASSLLPDDGPATTVSSNIGSGGGKTSWGLGMLINGFEGVMDS